MANNQLLMTTLPFERHIQEMGVEKSWTYLLYGVIKIYSMIIYNIRKENS